MKFIPILMSTMMVQALIALRKTMTRRTKGLEEVNENPDKWRFIGFEEDFKGNMCATFENVSFSAEKYRLPCPYGQRGDVLWVRETWGFHSGPGIYGGNYTAPSKRPGREGWKESVTHKAGQEYNAWGMYGEPKWKPNIHMPKTACRIFLQVESIRVERLNDIDPYDALEEGIEYWNVDREALKGGELVADFKNYMWTDDEQYEDYFFPTYADCILSFKSLWQSINGPESWDANLWVWVVSFKQINKPSNFLP